jgi:hypothetical protein
LRQSRDFRAGQFDLEQKTLAFCCVPSSFRTRCLQPIQLAINIIHCGSTIIFNKNSQRPLRRTSQSHFYSIPTLFQPTPVSPLPSKMPQTRSSARVSRVSRQSSRSSSPAAVSDRFSARVSPAASHRAAPRRRSRSPFRAQTYSSRRSPSPRVRSVRHCRRTSRSSSPAAVSHRAIPRGRSRSPFRANNYSTRRSPSPHVRSFRQRRSRSPVSRMQSRRSPTRRSRRSPSPAVRSFRQRRSRSPVSRRQSRRSPARRSRSPSAIRRQGRAETYSSRRSPSPAVRSARHRRYRSSRSPAGSRRQTRPVQQRAVSRGRSRSLAPVSSPLRH